MKVAVFIALAILTGCSRPPAPSGNQSAVQLRYQLVSVDGKTYRLDNVTGAVNLITADRMYALLEGTRKIHIGDYLEMTDAKDDAKFLKYLGNGAFEKSQWSIVKQAP